MKAILVGSLLSFLTGVPAALNTTSSFDECSKQLNAMPAERWNKDVYKFKGQPVLATEALYVHTYGVPSRTRRSLSAPEEYQTSGMAFLVLDILLRGLWRY